MNAEPSARHCDRLKPGAGILAVPAGGKDLPAPALAGLLRRDVRRLTPREMTELSLDLYLCGLLTYDEYALLAFQPELHPGFDRTIGALIGEKADPDRPRDYVRMWTDRLEFERRHGGDRSPRARHSQRILEVLRRLGAAARPRP